MYSAILLLGASAREARAHECGVARETTRFGEPEGESESLRERERVSLRGTRKTMWHDT